MPVRGWSAALSALGAVLVVVTGSGEADARGGGGFGGGRGGGAVMGGAGWGGHATGFGGRAAYRSHGFGHGHRRWGLGHHHRFGHHGRFRGGYGVLPYSYGAVGYGPGAYGPGSYDPGPSRSASQPNVGIPPSAYLPPAIYVIGDKAGRSAGRQGRAVRKGSGGVVADSHDNAGGSSVVVTRQGPDHRHRAR